MDVTLLRQAPESVETDALIVLATEEAPPALHAACAAQLAAFYASGEFKGAAGEHLLVHAPSGLAASRLMLIGCGKASALNAGAVRTATGAAVRHLRSKAVKQAAVTLTGNGDREIGAAVEGAILGDYEPDFLKTGESSRDKRLSSFSIVVASMVRRRPAPALNSPSSSSFHHGVIP